MYRYNIALSIFFACVAGYIYHETLSFPPGMSGEAGPAYWPSFLSVVLFLLAVALFIETLWKNRATARRDPDAPREKPLDFSSPGMRRLYAMLAALAVFSATLYFFGFLPAAGIFVLCGMIIFGERRSLVLGAFTVAVPAMVYVLFTIILGIDLP